MKLTSSTSSWWHRWPKGKHWTSGPALVPWSAVLSGDSWFFLSASVSSVLLWWFCTVSSAPFAVLRHPSCCCQSHSEKIQNVLLFIFTTKPRRILWTDLESSFASVRFTIRKFAIQQWIGECVRVLKIINRFRAEYEIIKDESFQSNLRRQVRIVFQPTASSIASPVVDQVSKREDSVTCRRHIFVSNNSINNKQE